MNTTFILRNKHFNRLTEQEKQEAINQVKKAYLEDNLKINELITIFDSTKSFMYDFLRKYNIKKSKEQLNLERSISTKKSYANKSKNEINEIKEKRKKTNLKRYGVENCYQSEDIKRKIKEECLIKYGVEHHNQRDDVKKKIDESNIKSQGTKRYLQTKSGKEKYKNTCLEKYGVENTFQSVDKKEKIKQTNLERYGYEVAIKNSIVREHTKQNNLEKYGVEYISQSQEIKDKIMQTNLDRYGVPWFCMTDTCKLAQGGDSNVNNRFANLLDSLNINYIREFSIKNYTYDFLIDNILLELNPTYTHNSTKGPYFNNHHVNAKDKFYHRDKSQIAESAGFRCIHIWDWDDINKVINLFLPKITVYARNCEIKDVKKYEVNNFLNNYHLQDTCKGQKYCLGLYYKNQLIELMTFGKPRYNRNYEYELLRLCSHKDYIVVGGSERLFKHFLNIYNPKSIISYCDVSKFSGNVYDRLGMKLISTSGPACIWSKGKVKITDNLLRQQGFDRLFKTNYGKGTSNRELMISEGFLEVYDCGQKVFEYK